MRQRSLSVLIAAATGLAMTGGLSSPANAMAARPAPASAPAGTDPASAGVKEVSYAAAITSWAPQFGGTAVSLDHVRTATGGGDRPAHPIRTAVWAGGTGAAADTRTVNRSESTEELAPSRRPASQFA
ncbi:hypothetical protein [Actinoplanes sp. HUAS TT8]|uniref:hypothetical protein n=1 Tax=Actinoplanes sp. HUAS TT8 TaxID=3447453 RepID=UPI003F51CE54